MDLDGLILFNVRVSSGRNTIGSCNIRVINLHGEKEDVVFSSRTLKHDAVHEARTKGDSDRTDPVKLVISVSSKVFSINGCAFDFWPSGS